MPGGYIDPTTGFSTDTPGAGVPVLTPFSPNYVDPADRPNFLTAGLTAGTHEAVGQLGSLLEGIGGATGIQGLRDYGKSVAEARAARAIAAGRPDLEADPWSAKGIGYQLAKGIPTLAAMIGGGALVPEAAVPAALARLAGGATAGRAALGAFGAQLPTQIGANIQSAERGGADVNDPGTLLKAAGLGVPEAVIGSVVPARLGGVFEKGAEAIGPNFFPDFAKRVFTGAVQNAPIAGLQSAAITAIDQNAYGDPNATTTDLATVTEPLTGKVENPPSNTTPANAPADGEAAVVRRGPSEQIEGAAQEALPGRPAVPAIEGPPGPGPDTRPSVNDIDPNFGMSRGATPIEATDQRPNAGAVAVVDPMRGVDTTDRRPVAGEVVAPPVQEGQAPPKFTDASETELRSLVDGLQPKVDAGTATIPERAVHAQLSREIAARQQPGLPDAPLFTPEQMQGRQPQIEAFRAQLADDGDLTANQKKLAAKIGENASSDAEMINALNADPRVADGTANKTLQAVAERFGIGRDLSAEMSAAMDKARTIYNEKGRAALVEFKQETIDPLQKLIDAHAEADKLRSAEPHPAEGPASTEASSSAPEATTTPARTLDNEPPPQPVPPAARVQALVDSMPNTTLTAKPGSTGEALLARFRDRNVQRPVAERGAIMGDAERAPTTPKVEPTDAERVAKVTSDRETADARLKAISEDTTAPDLYRDRAAKALTEPDPVVRQNMLKAIDAVRARPNVGRDITEKRTIGADPAHPLNGDIVKVNGDLSLVRKVDADGKPIYTTFDNKTGDYGDLVGAPRAVQNAVRSEELRDRSMAIAHPEGPFEGTKEKVVTTDGVSPAIRDAASSMMRMLGLGDLKLFIAQGGDLSGAGARDRYKLFGRYARIMGLASEGNEGVVGNFGPKGEHFAIHLKDGKSAAMQMEDLWHEIGHIHEQVIRETASPETKAALRGAFEKYLQDTQGLTKQEVIKRLRNREAAKDTVRNLGDEPVKMTSEDDAYLRSYQEWHADEVSKAMNSLGREPTTLVGKFFAKIADGWRKLVSMVTGDYFAPSQAILDAIKAAKPGDGQTWADLRKPSEAQWTAYRKSEAQPAASVPETDRNTQSAVDYARQLRDRVVEAGLGPLNVLHTIRNEALAWATTADVGKYAAVRGLPDAPKLTMISKFRDTLNARLNQNKDVGHSQLEALPREGRQRANKAMSYTMYDIAPDRPWEAQTWNHNESNAALLRQKTTEANQLWGRMSEPEKAAYNSIRAANDFERLAELYQFSKRFLTLEHPEIDLPSLKNDPVLAYRERGDLHGNPVAARDYMNKAVEDHLRELAAYVDTKRGEMSGTTKEKQAGLKAQYGDLLDMAQSVIDKGMKLNEAPSFHAGRMGDFFASAKLPVDASGKPTVEAIAGLRKILDARGFDDIGLAEHGSGSFFTRVRTPDQLRGLVEALNEAREQGYLRDEPIGRGTPDDMTAIEGSMPKFVQRMMARLDSDPTLTNVTRQQMRKQYLDMLSANSVKRVLSEREGVQGFSRNFIRSDAYRSQVASNAISSIAFSPVRAAVWENMRNDLKALRRSDADPAEVLQAESAMKEFSTREDQRQWRVPNTTLDKIRSLNYTAYLGASPAYGLVQQSQVAMNLLPELGKKYGYVNAAKAIGSATTDAFKIMTEVWKDPETRLTGIITPAALERAGISKELADTLMLAANRGDLELGGFMRAMTERVRDDAATSTVGRAAQNTMKFAASTALFAETVTRLQAAIAAAKLYDKDPARAGMPKADYISHVVEETMFLFNSGNTSRRTGHQGVFGQASPIMLAFSGFQTQMIGKLYRELDTAFLRNSATQEERSQARKFLAGHLAATTVLAGSLGLPMFSSLASVGDKVANALTGKDDWDIEAAYRNFLTDTFGEGVGEVLSKGAPRALGVDLSNVGHSNLIPFSRLLADRRKLEDSVGDWSKDAMGAPAAFAVNAYAGLREMMNGNWLAGAQRLAPTGLKGPIDATRMALYGYENSKNQKLPIDASTADIMMRALGLHPADKALYNEKQELLQGLQAAREDRASRISTDLTTAVERKDKAGLQRAIARANEFGKDHPDQQLLPSLGSNVASRAVQTEKARLYGVPIGAAKDADTKLRKQLGF